MKSTSIIKMASLLALLSVALGAFGAHALREKIDGRSIEVWETATRYQFYHVVALFIIALLMEKLDSKLLRTAAFFFILGILFFCGSLYFLATKSLFPVNLSWLGPITPLGGLCFMIGWLCLFLSSSKMRTPQSLNN